MTSESFSKSKGIIPIECFKREDFLDWVSPRDISKTFFARISDDGLSKESTGFILLPTISDAPQSSLVQMLHWIAQESNSSFFNLSSTELTLANLKEASMKHTSPVWLFSTALKLLELSEMNRGQAPVGLPSRSLIIETGGMKSAGIDLSDEELSRRIFSLFGPDVEIASEYGMSEIACQAYSISPKKDGGNKGKFLFSQDIELSVFTDDAEFSTSGVGSLCIYDQERIDVNAWIKTQDRVQLYSDRSFDLLGRVPKAPIKGCSLLHATDLYFNRSGGFASEDLLTHARQAFEITKRKAQLSVRPDDLTERVCFIGEVLENEGLHLALTRLLNDEYRIFAWSKKLVDDFLSDCKNVLVKLRNNQEFYVSTCLLAKENLDREWLLIPASSHPLTLAYAIFHAALLGINHAVRIPTQMPAKGFLELFIRSINKDYVKEMIVDGTARLDVQSKPNKSEYVMASCSDEMAKSLRRSFTSSNLFTDVFSFACVHPEDLNDRSIRDEIFFQAYNLAGRGCRNIQCILLRPEPSGSELAHAGKILNSSEFEFMEEVCRKITAQNLSVISKNRGLFTLSKFIQKKVSTFESLFLGNS